MSALTIMLRPIPGGWGVYLSNGREIARYRGFAAKWRALRHRAQT